MRHAALFLLLALSTTAMAKGHPHDVSDEFDALTRQREANEARQAEAEAKAQADSTNSIFLGMFQSEKGVRIVGGLKRGQGRLGEAVYFRINNGMLCNLEYDYREIDRARDNSSCTMGTMGWVECTSKTDRLDWMGTINPDVESSSNLDCRSTGHHGH